MMIIDRCVLIEVGADVLWGWNHYYHYYHHYDYYDHLYYSKMRTCTLGAYSPLGARW